MAIDTAPAPAQSDLDLRCPHGDFTAKNRRSLSQHLRFHGASARAQVGRRTPKRIARKVTGRTASSAGRAATKSAAKPVRRARRAPTPTFKVVRSGRGRHALPVGTRRRFHSFAYAGTNDVSVTLNEGGLLTVQVGSRVLLTTPITVE